MSDITNKKQKQAIEELLVFCESHGLTSQYLDDLVHDAKSQEASALNNEGLEPQLEYLLESWGLEELQKMLLELVG